MTVDYHGSGIVNLMASLQRGLGGEPHPYPECHGLDSATVAAHAKVFLVVIDGLGFDDLRRRPAAAWLNGHCRGALGSVYPPTTSAAITTFLTGDAPAQHAMVGWFLRFAEFPEVFAVLPGHARGGGRPLAARVGDLRRFLGHRSFGERIRVPAHVVSPAHIAGSPYNLAHLGPAQLHPFEGLDGFVAACARIARRPGPAYVYAYWHGLDAVGHASGMASDEALAHLAAVDAALGRLHEALRGTGSLLVVTADHGHLDTRPSDRHLLNDYRDVTACLDGPVSGEPRTVYCHLAPGTASRFEALASRRLGDIVELYRPEELLARGWYGEGRPHPRLRGHLGDLVMVLRGAHALYQRLPGDKPMTQVGVHGGMSSAELRVPLVVAAA